MKFDQQIPHTFSAASILTNAPAVSGVYVISNSREWIYAGVSDDIRASLLTHLAEVNTLLQDRRPTGFSFQPCTSHERDAIQDRMVLRHEPVCNRRPNRVA